MSYISMLVLELKLYEVGKKAENKTTTSSRN